MKHYLFAAVLIALPTLAGAQSQLERLEEVSEGMSTDMFALMVNEMAAGGVDPAPLREAIPDMTWDDAMREAGECMLEQYTALIGRSGVDEMLDQMDATRGDIAELAASGGTASDMPDTSDMLPEGLSMDDSLRITQDCGMLDIQMQRMAESGFSAAMVNALQ